MSSSPNSSPGPNKAISTGCFWDRYFPGDFIPFFWAGEYLGKVGIDLDDMWWESVKFLENLNCPDSIINSSCVGSPS